MDRRAVQWVVGGVVAFALIGLAGTIWLTARNTNPAAVAVLGTMTATAVGALVAALTYIVSTPHQRASDEHPDRSVP